MWPHEIDTLYSWYCTLPAAIVLVGTTVAVVESRASHKVPGELSRRNARPKFDISEAVWFGSVLWLFGLAFIKTLSWLVGPFSRDGRITFFYVCYALVALGTVTFVVMLCSYRPSMAAADFVQQVYRGTSRWVENLYHRHSSRWYFVITLTVIALAIIAVEKVSDFAFLHKYYYIAPAILFCYCFLLLQWFGALNQYADELAGYYLRRAERLSKWLSALSIVVILWISLYYILGVEHVTTLEALYAPTVFYGSAVWGLCVILCAWLATLSLAFIYRLPWVQLRKLSRQLRWVQRDDKSTVCHRIRKIGGQQATEVLRKALRDSSNHISARLAAARELAELNWQPDSADAQVWLAIGTHRWAELLSMTPDNLKVLLEVLDQTLYSPKNTFDGDQLSLVSIPAIETLGKMADSKSVLTLIQAVKLSYECEPDASYVPGIENSENPNFLNVIATRCEAANALNAMGCTAMPAVSALNEVLSENGLGPELAVAVAAALKNIQADSGPAER